MSLRQTFSGGGLASLIVVIMLCIGLSAYGVTEEVPIGSVQGTTLMAESGRPLKRAVVVLRPTFDIPDWTGKARSVRSDEQGRFAMRNIPAGAYTVEAYTEAHTLEKGTVVVEEGQTKQIDLELKPTKPYLELYASQHVFTPNETASLQARGFAIESAIKVDVYRVEFAAIARKRGLYQILSPVAYDRPTVDPDRSEDFTRVRNLDWRIKNRDDEGIFDEYLEFKDLPEGVYWVRASAGAHSRGTWLLVSRIALVTKNGSGKTMAYVTELESGKPVPGAKIMVATDSGLVERGVSDVNGTASLELQGDGRNEAVVATIGPSSAICTFYSYGREGGDVKIWTYTERPVYRPGDEVFFKAIVRRIQGSDYQLPPAGVAEIEVADPMDNVLLRTSATVSERGTLHGSFKLPTEIVGYYQLRVRYLDAEDELGVEAMAYRKPEFKITVTPEKPSYIRGQKVAMRVKCEYYFGGPVVGAELSTTVMRSPDWGYFDDPDFSPEESDYDEGYGGFGDYVAALPDVRTDARGEAVLVFDTATDDSTAYEYNDQRLTFEVSGSEVGDKYFQGKGSVLVRRGEVGLDLDQSAYVVPPGVAVEFTVVATREIDGGPIAGERVTVESGYERWDKKTWEFIREDVQNVTTGENGQATFRLTPAREGSFVVRASTRDRAGNEIKSEAWVYVSRGGSGWGGPAPNLQLVLDQKRYKVGGQALALIRTKAPGGSAWVTVESDEILWSAIVPLTGEVTSFQVPIEKSFAPNAQLTVAYVRGKKFYSTQRRLSIDITEKTLDVQVTPSADPVEPGQTLSYKVTTKTPDGRPVSADLSLGVVDEAIYAIRYDSTNPLRAFYPVRSHNVQTNYSFPELYLDGGDKGGEDIDIRTLFKDTAFWNPDIRTDENGEATVAVTLPDNLTSWRATVVACTNATQVGKATANIRARKELMIRLSAPSYMVQGDQVRISATVHNETGRDQQIQVVLTPAGLDVQGELQRTVSVGSGKTSTLEWTANAGSAGEAALTVTAQGGGRSDGMRLNVPIRTHGRLQVKFENAEVRDRFGMDVTRLPGATEGYLKIDFAPTVASTFLASIDSLVEYPYGCTEQTMSRFMPAVVVSKTLRDLGLPRPDLERKVPEVVRRGMNRLRVLQHYDGGFGWWENDQSEPQMTALVLEGLWYATQAGLTVDPFIRDKTLEWARENIRRPRQLGTDEEKRWPYLVRERREGVIYLAYALLLWEANPQATIMLRDELNHHLAASKAEEKLGASALAQIASGLARSTQRTPTWAPNRDKALKALRDAAQVSGSVANWVEHWGVLSTARAFTTLVQLAPQDPLVLKALRYLMLSRRGGEWFSTQDTAQVLVGLTTYLRHTKELTADFTFDIRVNGVSKRSGRVDATNLLEMSKPIVVPITDLEFGQNSLEVTKSGLGMGYVSVEVRQVPEMTDIGALVNSSGLRVDRTYHTLSARPMEDGNMRLMPSARPVSSFTGGEVVRCKLTIDADRPFQFVMLEAPTPANFRVAESENLEEWSWWFSNMSIFDDKVVFFARYLDKGRHTIEYNLRAEAPGTASALPALAYEMYAPDTRGSCAENRLTVQGGRR